MMCNSPHPDTPPLEGSKAGPQGESVTAAERDAYGPLGVVYCTRQEDHPGDHAAFGFAISAPPMTWPRRAVKAVAS